MKHQGLAIAIALAIGTPSATVKLAVAQEEPTKPRVAEETVSDAKPSLEMLDRILLDGVRGRWVGSLEYRDYGSGNTVSIPARAVLEPTEAAATLLRRITFTDPGREIVSTDLAVFESTASKLREIPLDGGPAVVYDIVERDIRHEHAWRIVLRAVGNDNRRPADLRVTWTCEGNRLVAANDVRYRDDESAEWISRNALRLERATPALEDFAGSWRVDLRPTPDAAPYSQPLVLTTADDGSVTGTFYGSPIEGFTSRAARGTRHIAFFTRDDSSTYHTSARFVGSRLVGRTHSVERDFLSVWTAQRDSP